MYTKILIFYIVLTLKIHIAQNLNFDEHTYLYDHYPPPPHPEPPPPTPGPPPPTREPPPPTREPPPPTREPPSPAKRSSSAKKSYFSDCSPMAIRELHGYIPPECEQVINNTPDEIYDPHNPCHDRIPGGCVEPPMAQAQMYSHENRQNANVNRQGWHPQIVLGITIPLIILVPSLSVLAVCCYRGRKRRLEKLFPKTSVVIIHKKTSVGYGIDLNNDDNDSIHVDPWLMEKRNLLVEYDQKLGTGAFCNVFKGKINDDAPIKHVFPNMIAVNRFANCDVAVKVLPEFASETSKTHFLDEINFMKNLKYHPHVISMLGFVKDERGPLLLVEYCSQGDLLHLIRNKKNEILNATEMHNRLKIKDLVAFSWQISDGLQYLHTKDIIHRDVAARNVLVNGYNVCKIADFGLCRIQDNPIYSSQGGKMPIRWMAPESLKLHKFSSKSDVWSYGILLFEIFSFGELPFSDVEQLDLLNYLETGARIAKSESCPDEIYSIMINCWKYLAEERPDFQEICIILTGILESSTSEYGYLQAIPDEPFAREEIQRA